MNPLARSPPSSVDRRGQQGPMVAGLISRITAAHLLARGTDPLPLLRASGAPKTFLADADVRLRAQSQVAFLEAAARAVGDVRLVFHVAQTFELKEGGFLYYILASSATLGAGFGQFCRYLSVENETVRQEVVTCGSDAAITWSYMAPQTAADRHQSEFLATAIVRVAGHLAARHVVPSSLQFVHEAAGPCDEMQAYFGCPISFGQDRNAVLLPTAAMDLVVERADPYLNAALTRLLDRFPAEESPARSPLRVAIEKELAERLPKGLPSPAELARHVGLSRRTLERRLAAEGTSIRRVSADLRRDLAVEHLRDSKHTITEIAWMLGYADVSSFTHAFRRITGRSPGSYRVAAK